MLKAVGIVVPGRGRRASRAKTGHFRCRGVHRLWSRKSGQFRGGVPQRE